MTFEEVLDQAMAMLQRRGRVTYRTLQLQFTLDDEQLAALKDELLYSQLHVVDDAGRGLVWTGDAGTASSAISAPVETPGQAPLAYTPPYLAEKILTSRSALEGERKQVTVLFADLKDSTELIRGLDPEAAQQLLDPALHHMMDAVHRFEGTVNQVLGAAILRLVEGLVQVTALGPVPVKGLTEPVEVFELTGASPLRRRLQAAAARGLTPFVGRQPELAALHQALAQAQAGQGQVVALVGEAGVGKSRLVHEVLHSHRTQDWRVLESASVSYGQATPYFPVIDLLKRYCHLDEQDDPRTVRAKVTGQVLTLDEALQDTIPALQSLLEVLPDDSPFRTLDPPQRRQRLLAALKRILLRESQVQPLLLVLEDLHWIDAETQALLDSLGESLPMAPLLLLVNYRPEYQHGWGSKTYYTQLRLDPLPPASAEDLLQALLGDDPSLAPLTQLRR